MVMSHDDSKSTDEMQDDTEKIKEIEGEFNNFSFVCEEVIALSDKVRHRIGIMLRDTDDLKDKAEVKEKLLRCEMARIVRSHSDNVNKASEILRDILYRLEI